MQATAFTRAHIMVARVVTGWGTGCETCTTPIFQAEHCNATNRGKLVSSEVLFVGIGIVIAYFLDYGLSFVGGQFSFRFPIAFQLIFVIFTILLLFAIPESPRWLMARGRYEEAIDVLERVRGKKRNDPVVKNLYEDIHEAIRLERGDGTFSWGRVLRREDNLQGLRRIGLGWLVQCFNQIGGINLVVYYITFVLKYNVGLDQNLSSILGGCVEIMFPVGSLIPSLFLDRMGRRKTMMFGSAALSFCMLMITILLRVGTKKASAAAVAFFFLYNFCFGASMNCCPWVYQAEIAPLALRSRSSAISISSNFMFNFAIVLLSPILTSRIGYATYIIFTVTNAAFVPIVYFFYPETSNKSLEEIDLIFAKDRRQYMQDQAETTAKIKKEAEGERFEETGNLFNEKPEDM